MKFFRKKKARPDEVRAKPATPDTDSFYAHHAGEAPLDEHAHGRGVPHRAHRTEQHNLARRYENDNRASNWALAALLFRAALIVVLLVGGFFLLKLILDYMAEPSDKDHQRWESSTAVMEQSDGPGVTSAGTPGSQELVVDSALIEQRLGQWELAARLLHSAEGLESRGIDEDAIQRLKQALHIMPDDRTAQQLLVNIYTRRGLYAEAVPLCLHLLDQNSQQTDLQMNLLKALMGSEKTAAGLALANRILLDRPNDENTLSMAAAGQIKLGNKGAALALLKRVLENNDKNKAALEGCGEICFDQHDYQNAIPYYLELTKLNPKPDYYQMLARCYAQQNEPGKTIIFMGQAASLFGEATVSPWFRDPLFDPVRETSEFRSFTDHVIGIEGRKAIEAINKRAPEKRMELPGGPEVPKKIDLYPLRPQK